MATKSGEKTGGRQKGTPDKFNGTVKEVVLDVFGRLGGVEGLHSWVKESASNKRVFYGAFLKMLPREVHLANGESPDSLPFRLLIESEEKNDSNA